MTAAPLEQLDAERLFERAHLMADGAMGHIELTGRFGHAAMTRGGLEGAQRIEWRKATRHGFPAPLYFLTLQR
jgi:hypothetical protein